MKKTYLIPEILTVQLGTLKMMAESAPTPAIDPDGNEDPSNFDVKGVTDKNLWDEEW